MKFCIILVIIAMMMNDRGTQLALSYLYHEIAQLFADKLKAFFFPEAYS